jgi:hypothetical protein
MSPASVRHVYGDVRFAVLGGALLGLRLAQDRAEAFVEGVSVLDRDRLGEAAGGGRELVEEADAAKQHESVAVPAFDEPGATASGDTHLGLPLDVGVFRGVAGVRR